TRTTSRSSASGCTRPASPRPGSCTSPRACTTTMRQPSAWASTRCGSTAATIDPARARHRRRTPTRTRPIDRWPSSRRPRRRTEDALAAPRRPDLLGVLVGVRGVDPEPALDAVRARLGVGAGPAPLLLVDRLEELDARLPNGPQDGDGRLDRAVVVEPLRPDRLVVAGDHRLVVREQAAESRVRHR